MDLLKLAVSFVSGLLFGTLFFGGLWITVRQIPTTQRPSFLIIFSFLIRSVLVMLGFVLLFGWAQYYALVSFISMFFIRYVLIKRFQPKAIKPSGGDEHAIKS